MTPDEIHLVFEAGRTQNLSQVERTNRLIEVRVGLHQFWLLDPADFETIAEALADGSRDSAWRLAIGESSMLTLFLSIIGSPMFRPGLVMHALRLIGNSCADEDSNRDIVVSGNFMPKLVRQLDHDALLPFAIPVLFNICLDYEPAQRSAAEAGIGPALLQILTGPRLASCRAFLSMMCNVLGLLVRTDGPSLLPLDTPARLLRLATSRDVTVNTEEYYSIVSVVLGLLAEETFQGELARQTAIEPLLASFEAAYSRYSDRDLEAAQAEEYSAVRGRFPTIIADVVAHPAFFQYCTVTSPPVRTLENWLNTPTAPVSLKLAACYALGNLARSDERSVHFVRSSKIHAALIGLLAAQSTLAGIHDGNGPVSEKDSLHYAVLSCLKNLAIPAANKPRLGVLLDPAVSLLPRLWADTTQPHVQYASISLTRLLVNQCPSNVRCLCIPLSTDLASPAHERSNLHVLADIFHNITADNAKMEAARVIITVCRVLHSHGATPVLSDDWEPPSDPATGVDLGGADEDNGNGAALPPDDSPDATSDAIAVVPPPLAPEEPRRARFYAALLDMADALTFLLTQTQYPVLRSETIFVCALMSCASDGARVAMRALQPFEACRIIVEAVSGCDMVDGHTLGGLAAAQTAGPGAAQVLMPAAAAAIAESNMHADLQYLQKWGPAAGLSEATVQANASRFQEAIADLAGSTGAAAATAAAARPRPVDSKQAAQGRRLDRENGLVLLSEMLKHYAQFLPPFRRSMLEQTVQLGAAQLAEAKNKTEA